MAGYLGVDVVRDGKYYFVSYNTEDMANAGISSALGDVTVTDEATLVGSCTGLVPATWTLSLETEVEAKIYFTLLDGYNIEDYVVTALLPSGEIISLDIEAVGERYRVVIDRIVSAYLDDYYTVFFTNTIDNSVTELSLNAMCYVARALESGDTALVNVAKALKLYSDAANYYFGKETE